MSDIPKYPNGSIGKLDAKAINKIATATNRMPPSEELASPNRKRTDTVAEYPIAAVITGRVDPDDEDIDPDEGELPFFQGYKWFEVKYKPDNGAWGTADPTVGGPAYQEGLRAYQPRARNAAYGLGISGYGSGFFSLLDQYTPDFTGKVVFLFPQRGLKGEPILTFQPPSEGVTYAARIIGYGSSGSDRCDLRPSGGFGTSQGLLMYELEIGEWSGFGGDGGSPVFTPVTFEGSKGAFGLNLLELNGNGHLGAAIVNDQNDVSLTRTPIPIGTYVTVHRLFRHAPSTSKNIEHDDMYGFNVANAYCVGCEGAFANTADDSIVMTHTSKDMRSVSRLEQHASNIIAEMTK